MLLILNLRGIHALTFLRSQRKKGAHSILLAYRLIARTNFLLQKAQCMILTNGDLSDFEIASLSLPQAVCDVTEEASLKNELKPDYTVVHRSSM